MEDVEINKTTQVRITEVICSEFAIVRPSPSLDRDSEAARGMQKLYGGNEGLTRNGASYVISSV